jgi:hypothetical protein
LNLIISEAHAQYYRQRAEELEKGVVENNSEQENTLKVFDPNEIESESDSPPPFDKNVTPQPHFEENKSSENR